MSVKIYDGLRVKSEKIVDFLDWSRDFCIGFVKNQIEGFMAAVPDEDVPAPKSHVDSKEKAEIYDRSKRLQIVMKEVEKASKSSYTDVYDLDCGLNLWVHPSDGYIYVVPIANYRIVRKLMSGLPEWVEEFSYWDNTDTPENVSYKDWHLRGKKWAEVCTGTEKASHNARRLFHEIFSGKDGLSSFEVTWDLANKRANEAFLLSSSDALENGLKQAAEGDLVVTGQGDLE